MLSLWNLKSIPSYLSSSATVALNEYTIDYLDE